MGDCLEKSEREIAEWRVKRDCLGSASGLADYECPFNSHLFRKILQSAKPKFAPLKSSLASSLQIDDARGARQWIRRGLSGVGTPWCASCGQSTDCYAELCVAGRAKSA